MAFPVAIDSLSQTWPGADNDAVPAGGTTPAQQDTGTVLQAGSGTAKSGSGTSSWGWASQFGADQEVWMVVSTLPAAGSFAQLLLRGNTLTNVGVTTYLMRVTFPTPNTNAATWEVRKKINGAASTVVATVSTAVAVAAGDSIGFSAIGTNLTVWKKTGAGAWAQIGSTVVDSSITTAGFLGFTLSGTIGRAGSVGGGSATAVALGGVIAGSSALTGAASVSATLAGTVSGTTVLAGNLGVSTSLAGTVAGAATLTGTLTTTAVLTGSLDAATGLSGTLTSGVSLAGTIPGVATLAGVLTSIAVGHFEADTGVTALIEGD